MGWVSGPYDRAFVGMLTEVRGTRFRHEALFYGDDDAYMAAAVSFLEAARDGEGAALVAVTREKAALLREWLGSRTAAVEFMPIEEVGRNPARLIPAWWRFLERNRGVAGELRGIGEPIWPGRSSAELDECRRHESLLELAFAGRRGWTLLCPYDRAGLDPRVIVAARRSHELGDGTDFSAGGDPPEPFAGDLPPAPEAALGFEFGREQLAAARRLVEGVAATSGLSPSRTTDLVTAASELTANSVIHGGGGGELCAWRQDTELLVEVRDRGSRIEDPLVGRVMPPPEQPHGRGLWLANQLCDLVRIRSGTEGTTVRLHIGLS